WDARGTLLRTFAGHDNWVRALVFHPAGKYLLSASDDKSIRCWDLSQDGKCVRVLSNAHGHFVSCMRWAPTLFKEGAATTTTAAANGTGVGTDAAKKDDPTANVTIRCVVATGGVDMTVRVWAS
ncbi:protein with putative role during mitosis, partial [Ascosphaera acerosa]